MNTEVGRPETELDLMLRVVSRLKVSEEGGDVSKDAMVFEYPAGKYNTS